MSVKNACWLLVFVLWIVVQGAQAEISQQMYYEGYYALSNGTPFSGYISLKVRLFVDDLVDTNEWTSNYLFEDTNYVWVSDGFYSIVLGDSVTFGSLSNALAGGVAFLETEINDVVQLPREQLLPEAYALVADRVRDGAITTSMIADQAIGSDQIADLAVTDDQLASDAVNSSKIQDGSVALDDLDLSGLDARFINTTGDSMTGPLCINAGPNNDLVITNSGQSIAIGQASTAYSNGIAFGPYANGQYYGTALGRYSVGTWSGVGVGYKADGYNEGTAVGLRATARPGGVAVGLRASGRNYGIAIGHSAVAAGTANCIAIGRAISNNVNNSAALRGSLYLDGGTGIFYRSTFGTGTWNNILNTDVGALRRDGSLPMEGPLDMAHQTITNAGSLRADGPVLIGTNVTPFTQQAMLVVTHTNEISTNANSSVMISSLGAWSRNALGPNANQKVDFLYRKDDSKTYGWEDLTWVDGIAIDCWPGVVSPTNLFTYCRRTYSFTQPTFEWGNLGNLFMRLSSTGLLVTSRFYGDGGGLSNVNVTADTNFIRKTGGTMTGPLTIDAGTLKNLEITSTGSAIMIGQSAAADGSGTAVGYQSDGHMSGAAIGYQSQGLVDGAALGYRANGGYSGAAVGREAVGQYWGTAVGRAANGYNRGVALGCAASAIDWGIAIGYASEAVSGGSNRVAIGNYASNSMDNSVVMRGSLYLDGGAGVYYRPTFGSGNWTPLPASGGDDGTNSVQKTGDTMSGALTIQSDLTVAGHTTIAYLPPQGDLPMGIYTNQTP